MKRTTRRQFLGGLALTTGGLVLAGCAPSPAPTEPTKSQTPSAGKPSTGQTGSTPVQAGNPVRGGIFKAASIGEPPTLDMHSSSATIVSFIAWHMYESLFTWDANWKIKPELAESHEVSDGELTNTIRLRRGVQFHNGDEMKSADVVASIKRWGAIYGLGKDLLSKTDKIEEADNYTIHFRMKEPFGAFATVLARNFQGCAIYPKSVVDRAGEKPTEEAIGTGPYKFAERSPDRFIRMERFNEYSALPGEPSGYGGHKYQYFDEIMFIPVKDEAARIAGLRAGDYHYLESISADQYETLKNDPSVAAKILTPDTWSIFVFNTKSGMMSDVRMRQAIQGVFDHEPMLQAGYGEGFYRIDPGIMLKETAWYTTEAQELYNRKDPQTAQRLAKEAGYDGTPIRILVSQQYQDQYNITLVAKQQLEAAGFKVDLQVLEWATLLKQRSDPGAWDIFNTFNSFRPDPIMMSQVAGCTWPGWWCSEAKVKLVAELQRESNFDKRFKAWEKLQRLHYEEVPLVKFGDGARVAAMSPRVQGFAPFTQIQPFFWNMWLKA